MVLSDDHAADVKRREGPDLASKDKSWSCSHCVVHLDKLENRRTVLKHLYTESVSFFKFKSSLVLKEEIFVSVSQTSYQTPDRRCRFLL